MTAPKYGAGALWRSPSSNPLEKFIPLRRSGLAILRDAV